MRFHTFLIVLATLAIVPVRCVSSETQPQTTQDTVSAAPEPDPTPLTAPVDPSARPESGTAGHSPDIATVQDAGGGTKAREDEPNPQDPRDSRRLPPKKPDYFARVEKTPAVEIENPDKIPEGQLRVRTDDGKVMALPLAHTSVDAEVAGFMSQVWVTQYFTNPYDHPIEAIYVFPLPQESAVDDMEMHIGERVIRGVMKEREEARRTYEAAKKAGKTASLLEQERPNIFTQSIANILPGDKIKIRIRYVETLKYEDGGYEFVFPMVVGPRYIPPQDHQPESPNTVTDAKRISPPVLKPGQRSGHDIDVTLTIDSGVKIKSLESPSHELITKTEGDRSIVTLKPFDTLPNKDLVVRYKTAGDDIELATLFHSSDLGSYFMLLFQPEEEPEAENIVPRELVFVVDCSGSMSGSPLAKAKQAMARALKTMRPDDYFQVIKFSDHANGFSRKPVKNTPENLKRALQFVDQMRGTGGTQMIKGIEAALDYPEDNKRIRIVAFMTDGYIGNDTRIIAAVKEKLKKNTRLFAFGIGSSVNRYLLDRMSEAGRGYVTYVRQDESPAAAVERFYRRIQTPVLVNIAVKAEGGVELEGVFPAAIPDLFTGQPLVVFGKYKGNGKSKITITGRRGKRDFKKTLTLRFPERDERNSVLGTLWARKKIKYFMSKMRRGVDPDIKAKVIELAIQFRIMSKFTSFVAVEEKVRNEGGEQETVTVPLEMPEGVSYEGVFGATTATGAGMVGAAPSQVSSRGGARYIKSRKKMRLAAPAIAEEKALTEKTAQDRAQLKDGVASNDSDDEPAPALRSVTLETIVVLSGPISEKDLKRSLRQQLKQLMAGLKKALVGHISGGKALLHVTAEVQKNGAVIVKSIRAVRGGNAAANKAGPTVKRTLKRMRFPHKAKPTLFKFKLEIQ